MQTKERLLSGNHFQVTLDIAAPDYVSANFTSREVQAALGNFLAEDPQIMGRVFERLGKTCSPVGDVGKSQNPPLPREDRKDYDAEMDSEITMFRYSKIQQTLDALENHKPGRVNVNSTQLLRDIRDNG